MKVHLWRKNIQIRSVHKLRFIYTMMGQIYRKKAHLQRSNDNNNMCGRKTLGTR